MAEVEENNEVQTNGGGDLTGEDGDNSVTMVDVLKGQEAFEEDANAVLGASDDKECTYSKGYIKRQALYACLTCCADARTDSSQWAGICLACSLSCHESHNLVELYTKRNFRCDCGGPKFPSQACLLNKEKTEPNDENIYNQNFGGLYCTCHRPYPDPESTEDDEMIQCIICEDWLHSKHLNAIVPSNNQYTEMICEQCMEKKSFLHDYSEYAVENTDVSVDVEISDVSTLEQSTILDISSKTEKAEAKDTSEAKSTENDEKEPSIQNAPDIVLSTLNGKEEIDTATVTKEEDTVTKEEETEKKNDEVEPMVQDGSASAKEEAAGKPDTDEEMKVDDLKETDVELKDVVNESKAETNALDEAETIDELKEKIDEIKDDVELKEPTEAKKEEIVEPNKTDVKLKEADKESKILNEAKDTDVKVNETDVELKDANNEKKEAIDEKKEAVDELKDADVQLKDDETEVAKKDIDMDAIVETKETLDETPVEKTENKDSNDSRTNGDEEIPAETETPAKETLDKAVDPSETAIKADSEPAVAIDTEKIGDTEDSADEVKSEENVTTEKPDDVDITPKASDAADPTVEAESDMQVDNVAVSDGNEINKEKVDKEKTDDVDMEDVSTKAESGELNEAPVTKLSEDGADANKLKTETENSSEVTAEPNKEEVVENNNKVNGDNEDAADNSDKPEQKRKLDSGELADDLPNKKCKIDADVATNSGKAAVVSCKRPSNVKKSKKGATFWPCNWRRKLCSCVNCVSMYRDEAVLFLLDDEDTVSAYEDLGKAKSYTSQYEKGLKALSSLDRIQQINAMTEYNKMKEKLLDFLKSFKDKKEVVKEEDIKQFFAGMKPTREPDGVYFCH